MLSEQQTQALTLVDAWLKNPTTPVFYLNGYAGTGKTTIAKELVKSVKGRICFAAFTGKAARVLRSKGCSDATTLHRLIYLPNIKSDRKLVRLQEQLKQAKEHEITTIKKDIKREADNLKRVSFALDPNAPLRGASLLVLDECSMVSSQLAQDALSFKVPILVLGDEAQLPPVKGVGYFTNKKPDFTLTEVHRQVADSPVLKLATDIRQGFGGSLRYTPLTTDVLTSADQVLVGKNETRRQVNQYLRRLRGLGLSGNLYPENGDRLVCLKNDHERDLLNGAILTAESDCQEIGQDLMLRIKDEDTEGEQDVLALSEHFDRYKDPLHTDPRSFRERALLKLVELDYAYALTVHKAQGSQWDRVVLLDDGFSHDRQRWLYTAITRAAKEITVCRFDPRVFNTLRTEKECQPIIS